jgi:signal transduction histidine kinase
MRTMPSIRGRLARALLAWAVAGGLAVAAAVGLAVQEEVDELLDDALRASAELLSGLLTPNIAALVAAGHGDGAAAAPPGPDDRFAWQVIGADRQVVLRSPIAPRTPLQALPGPGFADTPVWRTFGRSLGDDGRLLVVAQSRAERAEARFEAGLNAGLAALAVALLGYLWLRARVGQELTPLQTLTQRLAHHDPLQPGATLGPAQREELQAVHAAIDALAQRLARRVASERAFTAHAAHALRTPLAGIDAQLAGAVHECEPALRPRLARAREAAGRLQHVVAALLTLFRSGTEPRLQQVDLGALLERLPIEGLEVEVRAARPVRADPDLLAAALLNLLDNARRYGARRVVVSTPLDDAVRLHDDGPGIAPARRESLQAALDAQSYEATMGLGLMLADVVARAHGGRLALPDAAGPPGFVVDLELSGRSVR